MWPHPKSVTPGHSCVTTKPSSPKGVDMTENVREGGSKAMGAESGTVGPEGSERLTSGPDDALTVEANKWLHMCGSCDAGLTMNCTCPEGDYRSLIQRLDVARVALTAEVEDLKDALAEMFDVRCERDATIERLEKMLRTDVGSYIWIARGRQGGEPCIGGTRIPVRTVLQYVGALGNEAVLEAYPSLTQADIEEAIWFDPVERDADVPLILHEPGCSLDTDHKGSCVLGERISGVDECPCSRCAHYRDVAASIAAKATP